MNPEDVTPGLWKDSRPFEFFWLVNGNYWEPGNDGRNHFAVCFGGVGERKGFWNSRVYNTKAEFLRTNKGVSFTRVV